MDNQTVFDFDAAREARDQGIRTAIEHADDVTPRWSDKAFELLCEHAQRHAEFTSEDVRFAAKDSIPAPPDGRAWGGVFQRAARAGIIARAGYVQARDPKVHCNVVTLWRAA